MQPEEIEISNEDILLTVEKKLGHGNFRILSQTLKSVEEKIGLLGDHSLLNIVVLNKVNNQEKLLSFFVKLFPKQETLATFAHGAGAFQKEEFSYELFENFSKHDINTIANCVTTCYIAKPNQYMIFDNLADQEYHMPEKIDVLNYDSILVVLHSLAQLHASSIIYEEKMSSQLNREFRIIEGNEGTLKDALYCDSEDFINRDAVDSTLKCILTEIKIFQFPEVLTSGKFFLEAAKEIYPRIFELVKPSKTYRNVLCHGDLWASNFMLKRDKNRKVASCKFVDFQSIRYVPPAHDVLSLIYLTTSREFREKHLYELIGIYYSYLEKILKISGYNLNTIIPFSQFLESCEEQKLFAVLLAVGIIPLVLSRRDSIETYYSDKELYYKVFRGDRSVLITDNEDNDKFMTRARESVQDLMDECERIR